MELKSGQGGSQGREACPESKLGSLVMVAATGGPEVYALGSPPDKRKPSEQREAQTHQRSFCVGLLQTPRRLSPSSGRARQPLGRSAKRVQSNKIRVRFLAQKLENLSGQTGDEGRTRAQGSGGWKRGTQGPQKWARGLESVAKAPV